MPVRAVFGDEIRDGGRLGHLPRVNIGDAPGNNEVRGGNPVPQFLIADLLLHLREGSFGRAASCPGLPAARLDLMAQFPYRYAGTKDPPVCVKCRLGAFPESRGVLHLNGDAITLLQRNGRGLLQDGVNANDNRLRRFRNVREGGGSELADRACKDDGRLLDKRQPGSASLAGAPRLRA